MANVSARLEGSLAITGNGVRKSTGQIVLKFLFKVVHPNKQLEDFVLYEGTKTYNGTVNAMGQFTYNDSTTVPWIFNQTMTKYNNDFLLSGSFSISTQQGEVTVTKNNLTLSIS